MIKIADGGHFLHRVEEEAMAVIEVLKKKIRIDDDAVFPSLVGKLSLAQLPFRREMRQIRELPLCHVTIGAPNKVQHLAVAIGEKTVVDGLSVTEGVAAAVMIDAGEFSIFDDRF